MTNQAQEEYNKVQDQIQVEIEKLQTKLEKHSQDEIRWGHVGDIVHILMQLKQLNENG